MENNVTIRAAMTYFKYGLIVIVAVLVYMVIMGDKPVSPKAEAEHHDKINQLQKAQYEECEASRNAAHARLRDFYNGFIENIDVEAEQAESAKSCAGFEAELTVVKSQDIDLYYVFDKKEGVEISQTPQAHFGRNGYLATDISTKGRKLNVYAPSWDYIDKEGNYYDEPREYEVKLAHNYGTMGQTVELHWEEGGVAMNWAVGHMYEFAVKDGQKVKTGDIVGVSGGCPGELKENEVSTGCHVHIELRKAGSPIPYPTYQYTNHGEDLEAARKYKAKAADYGTRLQSFIDNYPIKVDAAKPFRDAKVWREIGAQHGIHSAALVCIGVADTGLGNKMKTPFNVGNAGNTATKNNNDITSPYEGMEAIAKALNGAYLADNMTIGSLSVGGGGTEHIYASSLSTWNKNVKWCLSEILGTPITESWHFRI